MPFTEIPARKAGKLVHQFMAQSGRLPRNRTSRRASAAWLWKYETQLPAFYQDAPPVAPGCPLPRAARPNDGSWGASGPSRTTRASAVQPLAPRLPGHTLEERARGGRRPGPWDRPPSASDDETQQPGFGRTSRYGNVATRLTAACKEEPFRTADRGVQSVATHGGPVRCCRAGSAARLAPAVRPALDRLLHRSAVCRRGRATCPSSSNSSTSWSFDGDVGEPPSVFPTAWTTWPNTISSRSSRTTKRWTAGR